MQQIADWLRKLDLGQYAQRFAENDIDVSVLRHLTDAVWKRLVSRSCIGGKCWRLLPSLKYLTIAPAEPHRAFHSGN
jgi:hypothetical protein